MTDKPSDKQNPPKLHITIKDFILAFWKTIFVWIIIGVFVAVAIHYEVDKTLIGGVVVINALGYFVSIVAIKKGYSKDVLNYRVLTIVLLIGIVIGYIIGKLI